LGAAISLSATSLFTLLLINLYIIIFIEDNYNIYGNFCVFKGMTALICFSLPFIGIQWIECSGVELLVFIAILLDKASFTAYIIIFNIFYVFYSTIASLEVMAIISVSKYITQYSIEKTKKLIYYIFLYITIIAGIMLAIILALNFYMLEVYMKDPEVLAIGKRNFFIIPIGIVTYLYMAVLGTIISSLGKAVFVFWSMISIFMGVGLILSYFIAIVLKMALVGIYINFIFTTIVMIIVYGFYLYHIDFEEAKRIAFMNIEEQNRAEQDITNNIEKKKKIILTIMF